MLEKEPADSFLNYALAIEYSAINEIHEAIRIITGVLQRDANYLGAYYQLGKLYEQTKEIKEAISIYKKGIDIAKQQQNNKALGELSQALMILEDE